MQVRMRQLGPGMFQQIQQPCPTCGATGKSVPPSDTCVKCNGSALVQEEKEFEITIEQGMRNGQRITLRGEAGSTDPNILPGDVLFIIETLPEESIKRVNSDLITEFEIMLKEALCGVNKTFTHLDDRKQRNDRTRSLQLRINNSNYRQCFTSHGTNTTGTKRTKRTGHVCTHTNLTEFGFPGKSV
eukprot:TRINITY_DN30513_c0_g1_i1.p1 TRINITY_DN30513_c0_g1~~TRINITY_DN30513_c0_g1_i1.p1  ORF type:complete len:186 (+),score=21.52 TRINITY_DN30513_c0_g1_i1:2-559(+)